MRPTVQDLDVTPGYTYSDVVRLGQPVWEYRPITGISGAPLLLSVPAHGIAGHWSIWVRGVTGMPALNREPPQARPLRAVAISADMLEINELSASGVNARGGEIAYRLPVDLAGSSPLMVLKGDSVVTLTLGEGLEVLAAGTIRRALTAEQTAALGNSWTYTFSVTFADGQNVPFFVGGPRKGGCGCG